MLETASHKPYVLENKRDGGRRLRNQESLSSQFLAIASLNWTLCLILICNYLGCLYVLCFDAIDKSDFITSFKSNGIVVSSSNL